MCFVRKAIVVSCPVLEDTSGSLTPRPLRVPTASRTPRSQRTKMSLTYMSVVVFTLSACAPP